MHRYIRLDSELWFPSHEYADSEGLLAIGGDLSPKRLMLAYANGIFPWYGQGDPILWWSPDPRFVLFLDEFRLSRKQQKAIQKSNFLITENRCFREVIRLCAAVPRKTQQDAAATWITREMQKAYCALHTMHICHSIEVWHREKPQDETNLVRAVQNGAEYFLAGGLYGVLTPCIFCGESMFSLMPEASRAALAYLVQKLKNAGHKLIDCQTESPHFIRMGARHIPRNEFLAYLQNSREQNIP